MRRIRHFIVGIVFLVPALSCAQDSVLKRKVSFQAEEERMEDLLLALAEEGEFSFSYNANLLPVDSLVTLNVEQSSVKTVLKALLGDEMKLRSSGNHLVILRTKYTIPSNSSNKSKSKTNTIDGYLQDNNTGDFIASATVYDVNRLHSTTTDATGYFSLEIPVKDEVIAIAVANPDFEDTPIVLMNESQNITIGMDPIGNLPAGAPRLGVGKGIGQLNEMKIIRLLAPEDGLQRSGTLAITTNRVGQVSFIPFVGTNLLMSGMVENKISLNVLAGYNGASNGLEIGGLLNITRFHNRGVQIAGIANLTGKETVGLQLAGIINTNLGTVKGVQLAGINNLVLDSLKGVQLSGINNVVLGHINGVQIAGINNFALKDVDGYQLAGISNLAMHDVNKFQFAGITNFGNNVNGGQVAGLLNVATGSLGGVQIASMLNVARYNRGVQLGLVNIADSVSGISIGLLNLVWKGYNKIEIHSTELLPYSARLKLGTNRFYNIFGIGRRQLGSKSYWGYSYGFGSAFGLGASKRNELRFDMTITDLQDGKRWMERLNLNSRLSITYSQFILKHLHAFAGPSWSQLLYDPANLQQDTFLNDLAPNSFYEKSIGGWDVKGKIGFEFGIRLL